MICLQVSPVEIELYIRKHPEVLDVAVAPIRDKLAGDSLPRAYVVKRPNSSVTEKDIIEYVEGGYVFLLILLSLDYY